MKSISALLLGLLLPLPTLAATVALDIGHSPSAPGVRAASGRPEHQFNMRLVVALASALTAKDHRVRLVDPALSLAGRARDIPGADLLVSIHHDSMQQSWLDAGRARDYAGFSVFVSQSNPHPRDSIRCARRIGQGQVAAGRPPSLYHASPVPGEDRPFIDKTLGVHRYDGLAILRHARVPAVLFEAAVIVNPNEERLVEQDASVYAIAHALALGIDACLGEIGTRAPPAATQSAAP